MSQIFIVLRNSVKEQWEGEVKQAGKVCGVAKAAWQDLSLLVGMLGHFHSRELKPQQVSQKSE